MASIVTASTTAPQPFSGWSGPRNPSLLFCGEAWGESEDMVRKPLIGASGQEFWRMLGQAMPSEAPELWGDADREIVKQPVGWHRAREAWLEATGIAFTNVFNFRPPNNKLDSLCATRAEMPRDYTAPALTRALYLQPEHFVHVNRLYEELNSAKPRAICALGNTACWALLAATNIGAIRGTISASPWGKVLPTYHPAYILRMWKDRPIVVADLIKARFESGFAEIRRPVRQVLVNPTMAELRWGADRVLAEARAGARLISNDIETKGGQITCIGFAASVGFSLVVPFVDRDKPGGSYWVTAEQERQAWDICIELLSQGDLEVLGQNYIYDLQYLTKLGIFPKNCRQDTMLRHHAQFPEIKKGLGFLGSIYTSEPAWKLMRGKKADTVKRDE